MLVWVVAAVAALGGLLFGFDTGVISGALLYLRQSFHLGPEAQEVVVSAVLVGCVAGAGAGGRLCDALGRKRLIALAGAAFAGGSALTAAAANVGLIIGGRVVVGAAIGAASYAVPLYISEVSPARLRGALVSLNQLMITIGILASYFVDDLFATVPGTWRWMFLSGVAPAAALLAGLLFLPQSPRWLASRGRLDKAREVLARLGSPDPQAEAAAIVRGVETAASVGWRALAAPGLRPVLLVGMGLMVVQQATGINTVIYYAPTIFEMAGFASAQSAMGATVAVGVVNVVFTVLAVVLVDKAGRRALLAGGLCGMTLALAALGAAFAFSSALGGALRWLALCSLFVYIASFALSLGPIAWLMISEIYPARVRGRAMAAATMVNWICNFAIALTFLSLVQAMGKAGAFWLYAGVGAAGLVFCLAFVPETKGVSLEAIEADLADGVRTRDLGKTRL